MSEELSTAATVDPGSGPAIICPTCRVPIDAAKDLPCAQKACPCELQNHVLCINRVAAQFGEASSAEMELILQAAGKEGWRSAVAKGFTGRRRFVEKLLMDPRRVNFVKLLDIDGSERMLDLGCGYGGVAVQLAGLAQSVTAVDITLERVALLEIIKSQEDIRNLTTLCNGNSTSLPFEDAAFDVVSMIGVLEYFPVSLEDYPVREAQRISLSEVCRILKPGGRLYLGTKNRFSWKFLLGARDHNNVPFGPVMPRRLADWICRRQKNKRYRIVSHSYYGYQSLLRDSGFKSVDMYWAVSGYQMPDGFAALHDGRDQANAISTHVNSQFKRILLATLARLGILRFVVPHFGIIAYKEDLPGA